LHEILKVLPTFFNKYLHLKNSSQKCFNSNCSFLQKSEKIQNFSNR